MKKTNQRRSKYFAPQRENSSKCCDHPNCSKIGEYRAPKDRNLKEYYWFCLEHVQEYNSKWNYYDGLDFQEEEQKEQKRKSFRFGANIKYNFGFDTDGNFEFYDEYRSDYSIIYESKFSKDELKCLDILEVNLDNLEVSYLKKQYKKMVKKYHPDLNPNNKDAEEKFKLLSTSYKSILSKIN